jgi:cytochrome d ubiquinol oxidase subunit I
MVYAWGGMMLIALLGLFFWWRKRLEQVGWYLWAAILSISLPYLANTAGWFTAEMGRQPWIVYDVMRVHQGLSKVVSRDQILGSLTMFVCVYGLLGSLFVFLLNRKIQYGPGEDDVKTVDDPLYRLPNK